MTVDKNQFLTLLMRYSGTSLEEAEGIAALKNSYPYSQVLQSLNAKVAKDHSLANHETLLQEAAIHCADRSVLKEIMSAEYEAVGMTVTSEIGHEEGVTEPGEAPKSVETIVPDPVAPEKPAYLVYEAIDGVDVADQVLRDLEKLNTLKHNFEMMFVEYTEVEAGESKTKKESERETFPIEKVEKPKDTSKSKKSGSLKWRKPCRIQMA